MNVLGLEDSFFSLLNSSVTPGRNLLSKGLGRGHKESKRNVLLE